MTCIDDSWHDHIGTALYCHLSVCLGWQRRFFEKKCQVTSQVQTSKGTVCPQINQQGPGTPLKTNAIVSDFMACVRKKHWRSWVHLQRRWCSIDIYDYYNIWTQLWLNPSYKFYCLTFIQMTSTRERESRSVNSINQRMLSGLLTMLHKRYHYRHVNCTT